VSSLPRLAAFISGGGRSLENLAEVCARGDLQAEIVLVLSSRPDAYGLVRAKKLGIPSAVLRRKDFPDRQAYSEAHFDLCREKKVDLVCLLGFLQLLSIPDDFRNRVVNIHPALLPSFGGKGMFGHHVHEAVLRAGEAESGCTVHFCDDQYDHGEIIHQRRCPVLPDDDPDTLAARVFEEEKKALPEALGKLLGSRSKG